MEKLSALNLNRTGSLDILAEVPCFQNLPCKAQSIDSVHFAEVSSQSLAQSGESCLTATVKTCTLSNTFKRQQN